MTEATGRENDAAINFSSADNNDDAPFMLTHSPGDTMNMQNYTQEYSYDAAGNITQLQHSASNQGSYTRDYTYNNTNNRLTSTAVGSNTYNYSYHAAHGFITKMPHLPVMRWNFKEELVASSRQLVNSPNIPETTYYQYDSKGKRLRKITENASGGSTPTQKDQRIYIEGYEYYEDFGSGEVTHSASLIDEGRRFVMIEDSNTYGYLVRYQNPNHQGSCTMETDQNGDVISYEEYHPFGTTSYQAMNANITAKYKRYRYTGMERDEETGLSYHNARYYIPWLGRWLSTDPIGIGDGVNVYAYCNNEPVRHIDQDGKQSTKDRPKTKEELKEERIKESIKKWNETHPGDMMYVYDHGKYLLVNRKNYANNNDKKTTVIIQPNDPKKEKAAEATTDKKDKDVAVNNPTEDNNGLNKVVQVTKKVLAPGAGVGTYLNENAPARLRDFGSKIQTIQSRARSVANATNGMAKTIPLKNPVPVIKHLAPRINVPAKVVNTVGSFTKSLAKKAPIIGGVALVTDIASTGKITAGHLLTAASVIAGATAILAAPAVAAAAAAAGAAYLVGTIVSFIFTGKSLEENLNRALDKAGKTKDGGTIFRFWK